MSADKTVLISGASFAGLSAAFWMNRLGYKVTVVEIAPGLKMGGTPVNIQGNTVEIIKRMGLYEQIKANQIVMEHVEFKNADDVTEGSMDLTQYRSGLPEDEFEIERDILLNLLFDQVKDDTAFIFGNSITSMEEHADYIRVALKNGRNENFDLVLGCDGIHSTVRKMCFGHEEEYSHFLGIYFSITIVNKLLIKENTSQFYNVPDKSMALNTYNNKTDLMLCFRAEKEIPYDYRDEAQQRKMIIDQFTGERWRAEEMLQEIKNSKSFYFDKLCQIRMPSWTKGRVALVGDAGYCASPAAGKGGSLAIDGAAALANAFEKFNGNFEPAFLEYNKSFRPFITEIQDRVLSHGLENLLPRTEEAIRRRNIEGFSF